jgi:hypothetical protein
MSNAGYSRKVKIMEDTEIIIAPQEQNEIETVSVQLLKSLVVKTMGKATGNQYIFNGAGSIVNIDKRDLDGLLQSNQLRQSCCGSYSSPYFNIV